VAPTSQIGAGFHLEEDLNDIKLLSRVFKKVIFYAIN